MKTKILLAVSAALTLSVPAQAQRNFDDVEIKTQELTPGIAVLFGAGGNIGVSHGEDGTILIDDQFAPLSAKIQTAISEMGAKPVKFLVNTHWHGDHTGGNENFGKAGAVIFAHDNVRVRMAAGREGERPIAPAPAVALPVVTYDQGLTFHINGDTVNVMFTGGGHTDGDSIIKWEKANIVHMGDLYFNIPGYPYVDLNSGGNVLHLMQTLDFALTQMDDQTKVIPGHGEMSNKAGMVAYRAMIGEAVKRVRALKAEGKTSEEAVSAKPLADFDRGEGFISADRFVAAVYGSLDAHSQ